MSKLAYAEGGWNKRNEINEGTMAIPSSLGQQSPGNLQERNKNPDVVNFHHIPLCIYCSATRQSCDVQIAHASPDHADESEASEAVEIGLGIIGSVNIVSAHFG